MPPPPTNGTNGMNGLNGTNGLNSSLSRTNFISGQRYTNGAGRFMIASATVHLTNAAVIGVAQMDLVVGARTNTVSQSTIATSIPGYQRRELFSAVNTNEVYYFTNTSSGANNGSTLVAGSGTLILQ